MTAHVVDRLSAYLDAELEDSERQTVLAHLRRCDECARHLEDLAAVDEMARALPLEAPGGYFETLPGRVRFKVAARRRTPRLPVWSWAVAAALLLAIVTPALLKRSPAPVEAPRSVAPALPPAPEGPLADSKAQPPMGGALREAPEEKQRSAASYDDLQSAALKRAPEARPEAPAAPAPVGGLAQGTLARNEAPPPLVKAEAERAKDKAQPARVPSAPAARAAFATPPEGALAGAAGQHLVEPKPEADDADSPATAEEAKKVGSATSSGGASPEIGGARRNAEAGRSERRAPKLRFRSLEAAVPGSAEEARNLREQWRAFVAQGPPAAQADEGRVRVVQMGVQAWRLSNDPADLILVKRDGEDYLRRADAAQGDRVRALLSTVGN